MEPVVRSRGRPRKRKWGDPEVGLESKKQAVEIKPKVLVGQFVLKEFEGSGIYLGKIVSYDTGLYRVNYEDGDCEDLDSRELRGILIEDKYFDHDLTVRRKKLDKFLLGSSGKIKNGLKKNSIKLANAANRVETPSQSEVSHEPTIQNDEVLANGDTDSSSNSCDARDGDLGLDVETHLVPPPSLPPSSGTIGVPEEYVSHLLSVYGLLRSFGIRLFLSPFGLNDLVGSLNCSVPNTLLDAIHVTLLSALRRHLETLSSDGSELASRCLRCIDWSLLDTLTWPVYLIKYLTLMGYTSGPKWKGFYDDVLDGDYYSLPICRKLTILQILCDDVLEFAEIRAELDMREGSEVTMDSDAVAISHPELRPRRVHPRYSKTSACKDTEAMNFIAESHELKSTGILDSLNFKATEIGSNDDDGDKDANGDECRLCGMDGTLLCCDGCPSAYHYRCIGVSKLHIPGGLWYCPECAINNSGLTITSGTSLRGAEIFGIDSYEQVFLGTCNHLLVLRTSGDTQPCLRYYNQNDIPKVLQTLHSSVQHTALYREILNSILKYWDIPESILSLQELDKRGINISCINEETPFPARPLSPSSKENCKVLNMVEVEKYATSGSESNVENMVVPCPTTNLDTVTPTNCPGLQMNGDTRTTHVSPKSLLKQIKFEPAMTTGSVSEQVDPSILTHQHLADRSNSSFNGHVNGVHLLANLSSERKEDNHAVILGGDRNLASHFIYMGSQFEPQTYINHYTHGDFAASAAANLAILSAEENRVSEARVSDNPRKIISADISLQAKAFALTAIRFFWPSSERKLVEVPRERCGWCFSCEAHVTSKRGCMLNAAASNAIKGSLKFLSEHRHRIGGEGIFSSIATYILYMEESLSGLMVGPFMNPSYRKQWQNQLGQASTCRTIKVLLLELEENIRTIALSGDWVKLVDNWLVEPSVTQNVTSVIRPAQKREPGGRRNSKLSAKSEVAADSRDTKVFSWWRGGMVAKVINQKWFLPSKMVKKAARQGSARKISGISYADGFEIPKISRQFIWRAAVEASKSAAQLAFLVRNLDRHVRWSDLVCSDIQDGKGPETEASAFRNAYVCDKKFVGNRIRYEVAFGTQKHLPSRVMKNVIETEQCQDGTDKYWFLETYIPLYLIKDYEKGVEVVLYPSSTDPSNFLSKLQRMQLKASRRDIFSYLTRKRDNLAECCCASCKLGVLLRNAVKCSACEGYCHADCTVSSTFNTKDEVEFLTTCKRCYQAKVIVQNKNINECPPVLVPNQAASNSKQAASNSKSRRRSCNWGIIWKKRNNEDKEDKCAEFRRNNILLKNNSDMSLLRPACRLCKKPYNSALTYIRCETCKYWYHAVAVELEESRICDVLGFKCCKCRRILSPLCPFMDQENKKSEAKKTGKRVSKQESSGVDSVSGTAASPKEWEPTTPVFPTEEVSVAEDKSLFCHVKVERIVDHNIEEDFEWHTTSVPGPQKLPVRRHVKREGNFDGFSMNDLSHTGFSSNLEENNLLGNAEKLPYPHDEEDMFDYGDFNYEDMEFEPQTYFSFTELLASEEGGQLDGVDESGNVLGVQESLFDTISQNGVSEPDRKYNFIEQQNPINSVEPTESKMPCRMCSRIEPVPDLLCQNCGYVIHTYCSPWDELSDSKGNWLCRQCREWR